jgi:pullulanase
LLKIRSFYQQHFQLNMSKTIVFLMLLSPLMSMSQNLVDAYPTYDGSDLGCAYTPQATTFRVWSPAAKSVKLRFYKSDAPKERDIDLIETVEMKAAEKGTWAFSAAGDRVGQYYTYQVTTDSATMKEVPDIYAKAVGANGKRAQIIDFQRAAPKKWAEDKSPIFKQKTDAIIYELHIRDATIHPASGVKNKGKFLGLTEQKTTSPDGMKTGLDYIADLGVTHVQILPMYDYFTVDENAPFDPKSYNWGYDPLNYNAPEGNYSTNPTDGAVRVTELRQMIQSFHAKGLRVVMDVVYNHTMFGEASYFHQLVPNYYHRVSADGKFSNGSGCGNETASDRPMMRKFMLESLLHWVENYHIDGFRFDLMGLHDLETMNFISQALHKVKPDILLYGEGWTAGDSPLNENRRSLKQFAAKLDKIGVFSDDMRDGLKGSVFERLQQGFVSGRAGMEASIQFGVAASVTHPNVDASKVIYAKENWAAEPYHCINYVECHDNHTLWDKLAISNPTDKEAIRQKMHRLANTIVLTSQGISFLHAGAEFMRTKQGEENSFKSPDDINHLDWERASKNKILIGYFKDLIALRKNHPAFRMPTAEAIRQNLQFLKTDAGVVAYTLNGAKTGDKWKEIIVIYNANHKIMPVTVPNGKWKIILDGEQIHEKGKQDFKGANYYMPAISTVILAR